MPPEGTQDPVDPVSDDNGKPAPDPDPAESNTKLRSEIVAVKRRAQAAEKQIQELESKYAEALKQLESHASRIKDFEFRDARSTKLHEILGKLPHDMHVPDMDKLQRYATRCNNPDTLEGDLKQIVDDFAAKRQFVSPTPPGTPPAPNPGDVNISDPWSMLQLQKANPAAFESIVAQQMAKRKTR